MNQVGNLISSAIEFKDLKQKEVAKQLGIRYSTFNNYACGLREPDIATLVTIFKFLDIDMNKAFNLIPNDSDYSITKEEAKLLKLHRSLISEKKKDKHIRFSENFVNILKED